MGTRVCDVAIIGAGSAGMVAWRSARSHTDSVVLIEGGPFGTTCARVGCMPSKLLIAAAHAAHVVRTASGFGVMATEPRIDGEAVMARVRAERDRFVGHVLETIDGMPPDDRLRGHVRFIAPDALSLDGDLRIEANRIVIATGSEPMIPEVLEPVRDLVDTNDTVFEWPTLPESVAVFGAGIIGIELGQALARLGVRVRMFGRGGGLAAIGDPEVRESARRALAGELPMVLRAKVREVVPDGEGVRVAWEDDEGEHEERFARVLAATGRRPRVAGLDLQHSGLELDARGIPVYDPVTGQCGDSPIFIAGDVTADRPLLHEAAHAGRVAGTNAALWPEVRAIPRTVPLSVVFCEPQVARVGAGFAELEKRGMPFAVGSVSFANQGRARVMRENAGLLRVYAEHGTGLLLGAEMAAPRAENLAHLLAWAIEARLTVARALEMPFYHPVLEEGLRTALREAARALRMGPKPVPGCMDCGPGG